MMKKLSPFTSLLLFIMLPDFVFANTGAFYGAGNQAVPIKNKDIQLVRENVDIKLTIEKDNAKTRVTLIPCTNVTAGLAKLRDVTADEYRSVLKQYYAMLVKYNKPASQFLSGYFQDMSLIINDKTQFMVDGDRKSVDAIAQKFDALAR